SDFPCATPLFGNAGIEINAIAQRPNTHRLFIKSPRDWSKPARAIIAPCKGGVQVGPKIAYRETWRRGGDSDARGTCGHSSFQDLRLKPLGHLSGNCSHGVRMQASTVGKNGGISAT